MQIPISSLDDTLSFGAMLGQFILNCRQEKKLYPRVIYLNGELGLGKTTFTRAFVSAFPGAEEAEVGSPSFTLCHEYPTIPEIYHADLYRLPEFCELPYELQDLPKDSLLLIEWAERLRTDELEENSIYINFSWDFTIENDKIENILKNSSEKLDNFEKSCEKKRRINICSDSEILKSFLEDLNLFLKQKL